MLSGPVGTTLSTRWRPTARASWSAASTSRRPRSTWRRSAGPRSPAPRASSQIDHEARRRRQAHDHRRRRPRQRAERPRAQVRFGGDNAVQQITVQQFKIGQTDVSGDWKRVPGGVEVVAARPLARAAARARHDRRRATISRPRTPAGPAATARANTKLTLQLEQVLTKRGTLGYVNGRLDLTGERIAVGRPVDRRRQGLDLPRHAGRRRAASSSSMSPTSARC